MSTEQSATELGEQVATLEDFISANDIRALGDPVEAYIRDTYPPEQALAAQQDRDDDLDPALAWLIEHEGYVQTIAILEGLVDM